MDWLNSFHWYALYTKPRHEKFVEAQLLRKGIEAFTPKVTLRRRWSDRNKLIQEPLFKSYCFARFSLQDRVKIVSQQGVLTVVHFNQQYIPIDDTVIGSLKILSENRITLDPCPYLKVGDRAVIRKGPLKGVEGLVIEKRNRNTTLVISVNAIVSSVQCVVDIDCVDSA
ncbi:MAG: UpxY family transcription antiterminator [Candidatus Omnitrophota bacterium]|nr:MAG: UpxY family transcription antiterminator [Candidatus Omnitrophota bacterium]